MKEHLKNWGQFLISLNWGPGNRDESAFKGFLRAASLGIDASVAMDAVSQLIASSGGHMSAKKLQSQSARAYRYVGSTHDGLVQPIVQPPTASFEPSVLEEVANKAPLVDAEWFKKRSPIAVEKLTSGEFLQHLYEPGESILVFTDLHSQGDILFKIGGDNPAVPRLTGDGVWFLVNPVDGHEHPNARQEDKPSRRSEESITSWRYLVLESDVAGAQEWLACLAQLPLKISAVYTSGGKSIHALIRVDAATKADWDEFRNNIKPILVTLGADPAAMTGVRLSRLPGVMRGLQKQELLYLNPSPTDTPIIES